MYIVQIFIRLLNIICIGRKSETKYGTSSLSKIDKDIRKSKSKKQISKLRRVYKYYSSFLHDSYLYA